MAYLVTVTAAKKLDVMLLCKLTLNIALPMNVWYVAVVLLDYLRNCEINAYNADELYLGSGNKHYFRHYPIRTKSAQVEPSWYRNVSCFLSSVCTQLTNYTLLVSSLLSVSTPLELLAIAWFKTTYKFLPEILLIIFCTIEMASNILKC